MKRWITVAFVLLLIICAVGCSSKSLRFAKTVTVDYGNWSEIVAHADDGKTVVIDDPEDVAVLVKIFSNMKSDNGSDCGYYTYQITFEGNGKQEVLYPAGDNCDTVSNENGKYYVMGDENKNSVSYTHLAFVFLTVSIQTSNLQIRGAAGIWLRNFLRLPAPRD